MPQVLFGDRRFDADLIVFDKDGVLLDFTATWRPKLLAAVDSLLHDFPDPEPTREKLLRTLGYDPKSERFDSAGPFATATSQALLYVAATVLFQTTSPRWPWDACVAQVRERFLPQFLGVHELKPVGDLRPLLESLHERGVRLAVVTSDDLAVAEATLQFLGIRQYVDQVIGGDGPHPPKPAPDAFLAVCAELDASPSRAAMVGDAVTDLQMATDAGAGLRVGVLTGVSGPEELIPWADVILSSILEIHPPEATTPPEA